MAAKLLRKLLHEGVDDLTRIGELARDRIFQRVLCRLQQQLRRPCPCFLQRVLQRRVSRLLRDLFPERIVLSLQLGEGLVGTTCGSGWVRWSVGDRLRNRSLAERQ